MIATQRMFFSILVLGGNVVLGCTNILVSRGASTNNATQLAYNADSGNLFGSLSHYKAADHKPGAMREIWDWDDSIYLGSIPEVAHTFNVVGNINEHGLMIGETTFGGLKSLDGHNTGAIMDYGSLIWVTLQRAKTSVEAIHTIDDLCTKYGYASDGESFSISDGNTIWLMELIGKGKDRGAVWVATRVPEGYVGSTANQARTRTFAFNDPTNVLYAHDVVEFAQSKGLYPHNAAKEDFSFSDVYDPVTFTGARLAEARVFNLFNAVSDNAFAPYLDYAQGHNLTHRMPLFAKAATKLAVNDTMRLMRTHFEGTWFDPTGTQRSDVGSGSGHSPYRWRPLVWSKPNDASQRYVNERTIGVQQTAWNFVATSRPWLPAPFRALMFWAPDDSSTSVRIPIYGGTTSIPLSFADAVGQEPGAAVAGAPVADAFQMNLDSAFWVWNLVSNMAYGERYQSTYPLILSEIVKFQDMFFESCSALEKTVVPMYENDPDAAIKAMTKFVVETGEKMTTDWRNFWMTLFARFRDGFTITKPVATQCNVAVGQRVNCTSRNIPIATQSGYDDNWYSRIIQDGENDAHYRVPTSEAVIDERKLKVFDKARPR
jgi:dipeptidase